jgi:hypothetical protein
MIEINFTNYWKYNFVLFPLIGVHIIRHDLQIKRRTGISIGFFGFCIDIMFEV